MDNGCIHTFGYGDIILLYMYKYTETRSDNMEKYDIAITIMILVTVIKVYILSIVNFIIFQYYTYLSANHGMQTMTHYIKTDITHHKNAAHTDVGQNIYA